jgi:hypothetical protein
MSFTFRNPFHTQETIIRSAENPLEENYCEEEEPHEEEEENQEQVESVDTWVQTTATMECCSRLCLQGKKDLLKVH